MQNWIMHELVNEGLLMHQKGCKLVREHCKHWLKWLTKDLDVEWAEIIK